MPLYFDKILSQLAYPLGTSLCVLFLAVLLLLLRRFKLAGFLMMLAIAWLTLWSLPPAADQVRLSLENRYPQLQAESMPVADVIILLGGGMYPTPPDWPHPGMGASADRVWHAARLYHAGTAPLIIATGGPMGWDGERNSGSESMRRLLLDLGVPDSAILLDGYSRSTRDNAVFSQQLMRQQGLQSALLVTSALHMHRSMATFRAVGLDPIPAATDFEVAPEPNHVLRWLPDAEALHDSTRAIHEYLGLWTYQIRGWANRDI
jgi:uncharacterized SAM-binding protein YcdF (DUF218 family)